MKDALNVQNVWTPLLYGRPTFITFFFLGVLPSYYFQKSHSHCDALKFANQEITITSKVMEVKFHTRVSPLYYNNQLWVKKEDFIFSSYRYK